MIGSFEDGRCVIEGLFVVVWVVVVNDEGSECSWF